MILPHCFFLFLSLFHSSFFFLQSFCISNRLKVLCILMWSLEVNALCLIHIQCKKHCGSGVWEPQDQEVTDEQETVTVTQCKCRVSVLQSSGH